VIVHQLKVGPMDVFAYVVGCETTRCAALIDPAAEVDRVVAAATADGLEVTLILNTHPHGDHTAGNLRAKQATGAPIAVHRDAGPLLATALRPAMAALVGGDPSPPADRLLDDGEILAIGDLRLRVIHTPGHSPGGMCLVGHGAVFTGDVLFVGAVGRTDLEGGSARGLRASIRERLFDLPDATVVYPGHDYGDSPTSTIERERRTNPFV
jgi:glyoxylase-like metal-dependent hydrolase (beta-lactamase superfamily II)